MISVGTGGSGLVSCDYCRGELRRTEVTVVQIEPAEGAHDSNLALVCRRCAGAKGSKTRGIDPIDGSSQPLFHPRKDRWSHHFVRHRYGIRARDAIGRATSLLLFRAPVEEHRVGDLRWDALRGLSSDHPVYHHLNYLRHLRLGNHFSKVLGELELPAEPFAGSAREREIAQMARHQLFLETCFTRAQTEDVSAGLELATCQNADEGREFRS